MMDRGPLFWGLREIRLDRKIRKMPWNNKDSVMSRHTFPEQIPQHPGVCDYIQYSFTSEGYW